MDSRAPLERLLVPEHALFFTDICRFTTLEYRMGSLIQQDSYWFAEGEDEEAVIKAMCTMCAKKAKKGWFWEGRLGYGDYDLFCCSCGNAIHIRGDNGLEAGDKGQEQQAESGGMVGGQAAPHV
jgi:hypothetical protein